ncbi:hypothetical protein F4814DRAFT_298334 [Daldinia grandis]|nr:hypothetical protein F4814DRAFT_298334 [Daldinia grandis]
MKRGYACSRHSGGQTCITTLTRTTVPTVTCESGISAHFEYVTIPYVVADSGTFQIISTFTVFAPLFQLHHQASDLPSTTETATDPSANDLISSLLSQTPPLQALPTQSSSGQGLSVGAQAGIGCGVAFGIIILGTIAFCLFRSRRQKAGQEMKFPIGSQTQAPMISMGTRPSREAVELDGNYRFNQEPYQQSTRPFS